MRQPGKHEIDVMVLRLKFAGRFGDVGGHHFFPCGLIFLVFRTDVDRGMPERTRRYLVSVLIQNFKIFGSNLEDHTPDPVTDRRRNAREPASPDC